MIEWPRIVSIRYVAKGTQRFLVLVHQNSQEHELSLSDALELYRKIVKPPKCSPPCWYRHECSTPPETCRYCDLGSNLEQLECDVRPDAIEDRRTIIHSELFSFFLIVAMWAVLLAGAGIRLLLYPLPYRGSVRGAPIKTVSKNKTSPAGRVGEERRK